MMEKSQSRTFWLAVVLFAVAAIMILAGTVGAVSAAPRAESSDYRAQMALSSVQTALVENGSVVEGDDALLGSMLEANGDDSLKVGKRYSETLAVRNVGSTDEYVRVTVRCYWVDGDGKALDLDPSLIDIGFVTGSGWSIDESASTEERTVLYYASPVAAGGETSPFVESIAIDGSVVTEVTQLAAGGYEFDYEGVQFKLEATADAVQTHNAQEAMTGAWGRTV